jgi:hypothetical protein
MRVVKVLGVSVAMFASSFDVAEASNALPDTSVTISEGGGDTATLSAIGKDAAPGTGVKPSSAPQEQESESAPPVDPCTDATNSVAGFDYSTCWVATPTFGNDEPTPADARQRVVNYVRSMRLPKPRPEISAPNGGICGVVHTLDLHIDDVNPAFYDPTTDFGPMVVRFHGKFTVDWGDGTKNVYRTSGGPHPSVIGHSWTDRGFYNITVTADWTAEWSLGGFSGVVGGFRTTGSIDQWRVWEAQAMLTG